MAVDVFKAAQAEGTITSTGTVTTAETTLGTATLQAQGFVGALSVIHVIAWGTVANNANAKTLTLYFGAASQAFTLQASTANSWKLDAYFVSTGAATQTGTASVICGTAAASTGEAYTITPTENSQSNIVVKVTGTATTTNDIVSKGFLVFV